MKFPSFDYQVALDVEHACFLLAQDGARPLAGGQSLLPMMAFHLARPTVLVDITRLTQLKGISVSMDSSGMSTLRIGATTTHSELEQNEVVRSRLPVIAKVASYIGHPAIRHLGTIGGSVAHADPAAEWPATCIALEAQVEIWSKTGVRKEPAESFLIGPYQTSLAEDEIIGGIEFPLKRARHFGISEIALRPGDFALAGAVCVLTGHEVPFSGTITIFGVEGIPRRIDLTPQVIEAFTQGHSKQRELADILVPRLGNILSDVHASQAFRSHLATVVASRALVEALSDEMESSL